MWRREVWRSGVTHRLQMEIPEINISCIFVALTELVFYFLLYCYIMCLFVWCRRIGSAVVLWVKHWRHSMLVVSRLSGGVPASLSFPDSLSVHLINFVPVFLVSGQIGGLLIP